MPRIVTVHLSRVVEVELLIEDDEDPIQIATDMYLNGDACCELGELVATVVNDVEC